MKHALKWVLMNGAVMAFFIWGGLLPIFWHDFLLGIFVAFAVVYLAIFFIGSLSMWLVDIPDMSRMSEFRSNVVRSRLYWAVDVGYDIVLIGLMAAGGYDFTAVLWFLCVAAFWAFKISFEANWQAYEDWRTEINALRERLRKIDPFEDCPEWMRDS